MTNRKVGEERREDKWGERSNRTNTRHTRVEKRKKQRRDGLKIGVKDRPTSRNGKVKGNEKESEESSRDN